MQVGIIRVVLVDDHRIVRDGFSAMLNGRGIEVVGEGRTLDEAIKMYEELMPDVLVLDIRFEKQRDGLDAAKQILQKYPDAAIVFLSQFDQDSFIQEAYKLGGRAFVTKDCEPEELAEAVITAHRGQRFFLPNIAKRLADLSFSEDTSPQSVLDKREMELFALLARGLTIVEMADALSVSQKTISNLIHAIKVKLGITRTADITLLAVKHGVIDPN